MQRTWNDEAIDSLVLSAWLLKHNEVSMLAWQGFDRATGPNFPAMLTEESIAPGNDSVLMDLLQLSLRSPEKLSFNDEVL